MLLPVVGYPYHWAGKLFQCLGQLYLQLILQIAVQSGKGSSSKWNDPLAEVIQKLAKNGRVDLTSLSDGGMTCGKPNAQSEKP